MTKNKPYRRPKPRQSKLHMRDIARMTGLSAQTISRYFKDPTTVGATNRETISRVVAETGYFPNPAASSLSANRTSLVAIIVPTLVHSIFSEIVTGLSSVVESRGHDLLIAQNGYSLAKEEKLVERFLAYKMAGIALIGQLHSERTVRMLRSAAMPTVELLEIDNRPIDMAIGLSNFTASYEITRQLIALGRRRIGFISALPDGNDRVQRRLDGYRAALREAGLPDAPGLVAHAGFKIENGARVFAQMHREHADLDAVISNDVLGLGILVQCEKMGLSVPDRIAITGFDNLEVASILGKKMTTVKFDSNRMGVEAGQRLLAREPAASSQSKVVDLGYEILWRNTTPCQPGRPTGADVG